MTDWILCIRKLSGVLLLACGAGAPIYSGAKVIDEFDRRTEDEFAESEKVPVAEIRRRFGATGKLICKVLDGSAQLTIRNNIITSAAHLFVDQKTCRRFDSPQNCVFEVVVDGSVFKSKVISEVESGFKCPLKPKNEDDWIILKLADAIPSVAPYVLPDRRDFPIMPKDPIIAVAGSHADFFRYSSSGKPYRPKSFARCMVVNGILGRDNNLGHFSMTCDMAEGASGGSILQESSGRNAFALVGIISGVIETHDELVRSLRALRNGMPLTPCRFEENKCASYTTAVSGQLFRALEALIP